MVTLYLHGTFFFTSSHHTKAFCSCVPRRHVANTLLVLQIETCAMPSSGVIRARFAACSMSPSTVAGVGLFKARLDNEAVDDKSTTTVAPDMLQQEDSTAAQNETSFQHRPRACFSFSIRLERCKRLNRARVLAPYVCHVPVWFHIGIDRFHNGRVTFAPDMLAFRLVYV